MPLRSFGLRAVACSALITGCSGQISALQGSDSLAPVGAPADGALDASTGRTDAGARADGGTASANEPKANVPTIERDDDCPKDAPLAVDRVRIYPGAGASLAGVRFQGSNEGTTVNFVDLGTLATAPKPGGYTELKLANTTIYRYVRFFDPEGRDVPIAEVEFYHGDTKLSGKAFGTVASANHTFDAALDGNTSTYYQGKTSGGNYIGLDIAGKYVASTPTFTPAAGALSGATKVTIVTATSGASIHYTTDGTAPTMASPTYAQPIAAGTSKLTLRAVSVAKCYFTSESATASYGVAGQAVGVGQKSYHLGNSLTDTIDGFLKPIADSTGVTHAFARWTIPGAPISWQANPSHVDNGTAVPDGARNVTSFVKSFLPDHMTVQPFSVPGIEIEGNAALTFLQPGVAANPNLQAWIYAQWPTTDGYLSDPFARGDKGYNWPAPATPVPNTWEDTADAQLRFYEAFADFVDGKLDGKKVLVIPGGPALANLKRQVDAGKFPGISNFMGQVFQDEIHLRNSGRYLVSLVFYACFYKANPVDKVTDVPDEVSAEQAAALRQIAWQTASGYARCGIAQ